MYIGTRQCQIIEIRISKQKMKEKNFGQKITKAGKGRTKLRIMRYKFKKREIAQINSIRKLDKSDKSDRIKTAGRTASRSEG